MKTSSSTFEPKQSDMTYWYNTVTGYTIVAEKDINTATLEKLLPQEVRYSKSKPASITEWIDLSTNIILPDISITNFYTYTSGGMEGFRIDFYFPNPKYNNITIDNIYIYIRKLY